MVNVYRMKKDKADWLLRLCNTYAHESLAIRELASRLRHPCLSVNREIAVPMYIIQVALMRFPTRAHSQSLKELIKEIKDVV